MKYFNEIKIFLEDLFCPLHWEEIKSKLDNAGITIEQMDIDIKNAIRHGRPIKEQFELFKLIFRNLGLL